ncbi:MAG TPA: MoaD/ThiS family protein [Phycicoccus sp.]
MDSGERGFGPADATAGVTVRYWAGARAAAGVETETVPGAATVGELVDVLATARPALAPVLAVASLLVDGRAGSGRDPIPPGALVEVLPPFAGG